MQLHIILLQAGNLLRLPALALVPSAVARVFFPAGSGKDV